MNNERWLIEMLGQPGDEVEPEPAPAPAPAPKRDCPRCGGSGRIPSYQHIKAGECFRCHGSGVQA